MKNILAATLTAAIASATPLIAQEAVSSSEIADAMAQSSAGNGVVFWVLLLSILAAALGGNGVTPT